MEKYIILVYSRSGNMIAEHLVNLCYTLPSVHQILSSLFLLSAKYTYPLTNENNPKSHPIITSGSEFRISRWCIVLPLGLVMAPCVLVTYKLKDKFSVHDHTHTESQYAMVEQRHCNSNKHPYLQKEQVEKPRSQWSIATLKSFWVENVKTLKRW